MVKDSNGTTLASFSYDSKGMRKTMTTSSGTITFHYDENNNVVYETDSSNAVVASYTWNGIQPVSMTRGGQTYYYQLNGHGDVVTLTDSTGAVVNTYDYDAFGNVVKQTGTVVNPYLYAGYRFDKETGFYYLKARYYDSKTGRFLTQDTFEGDQNRPLSLSKYVYTENNPVINFDPDGNLSVSRHHGNIFIHYSALEAWTGAIAVGILAIRLNEEFGYLFSKRSLKEIAYAAVAAFTVGLSRYIGYNGTMIAILLKYRRSSYKAYEYGHIVTLYRYGYVIRGIRVYPV